MPLTDRRAMVILAAILVALFADVLFLGTNFYARDVSRFYIPATWIIQSVISTGHLPLWNAFWGAGQPLAANPGYGAFYPGRLLLLFLSYGMAFKVELIAQYAIAAAGMYALVRSLGARSAAALFGAVSYAFGGLLASYSNLVPFLESTAVLPWIALFVRRFLIRRRRADFAGAVIFLGVLLLAADQSMILQTGAMAAGYAAWRGWRELRSRGAVRAVALIGLVVIASTLVALVQIAPALDLMRDTPRGRSMTYEHVTLWSLSPLRPVESLFPDFFGRFAADRTVYWGTRFVKGFPLPFAFSLYPGLAATLLALAGLGRRIRGWAFIGVGATVSFLIALGRNGFVFPLLYAIGLRSLRYPEKFITTAVFLLTLLAALAWDRLFEDDGLRRLTARFAVGTAFMAAAVLITSLTTAYPRLFAFVFANASPAFVAASRTGWAIAAVTSATLAVILVVPLQADVRAILLALFVAVDVLSRFGGLVPRIDPDYYAPPPAATALAAAGQPVRLYNDLEWRRSLGRSQQPRIGGIASQWSVRNGLLPEMPSIWGIESAIEPDITESYLTTTTDFTRLFISLRSFGRSDRTDLMLHMAGVTHVAAERRVDPASIRTESDLRTFMPVRIIPLPAERYYFADSLVHAPSVEAIRDVLLGSSVLSPRAAFVPFAPFHPAPGRVIAARESANAVDLDVTAAGPSFLVVAITGHRYWQAAIDGRPTAIEPSNLAFQGVVVPGGRHHVAFRYSNPVVATSMLVSTISILAIAVIALSDRFRRRHGTP